MEKSNKAIVCKLFPTQEQVELIDKTIGCVRFVYNKMLNDKIEYYKTDKKMLKTSPAQYKKEFEFLKEVDSIALCNAQLNLQSAFSNFFRDTKVGFPKFKSKKRDKNSYTTNYNNGKCSIINSTLIKIPKLGKVSIDIYREIPKDWKFKSITIERRPTGEYYGSLLFEFDKQVINKKLDPQSSLGLDYSSPKFYVDSNGNSPDKLRFYRENEPKLAKEQRKLSKMEYQSQNWYKQKIKVAEIQEHTANQRKDFLHKLSYQLAETYDYIFVEDINLQNMVQTLHLGKSTNDNGFGTFRSLLSYKLEDRGKKLIKVDKWYPSSKICNHCGSKNTELTLMDRTWVCKECGSVIERDYNAAINIRNEGIRLVS